MAELFVEEVVVQANPRHCLVSLSTGDILGGLESIDVHPVTADGPVKVTLTLYLRPRKYDEGHPDAVKK